jgi:hypothetical protein
MEKKWDIWKGWVEEDPAEIEAEQKTLAEAREFMDFVKQHSPSECEPSYPVRDGMTFGMRFSHRNNRLASFISNQVFTAWWDKLGGGTYESYDEDVRINPSSSGWRVYKGTPAETEESCARALLL